MLCLPGLAVTSLREQNCECLSADLMQLLVGYGCAGLMALPHSAAPTVQGTLRVLLVLLHDFPEFLCEYHFELCNKVPPSCIQMRNLILSAFPRMMRLPDPFTPNLKVCSPSWCPMWCVHHSSDADADAPLACDPVASMSSVHIVRAWQAKPFWRLATSWLAIKSSAVW